MSAKATAWAWSIEGISVIEKVVLVRLGDHANDQGICWPGKDTLATACCASKRTVDRAIQSLTEKKLISLTRRATDTGKNRSNVYQLHMDQGDLFKGVSVTGVSQRHGCQSDQLGVSQLQGEGVTVTPESPIEPKTEPLNLSSSADEVQKKPVYETKKGKKLTGEVLDQFLTFWEAFGYKAGKAESADAWLEQVEPRFVNRLVTMDHILAAAKAEALNRPRVTEAGMVAKMPQGWLSARRWEDHEPEKGARAPKAMPWYHTLSGIQEEAGNRGIMQRDYPDLAALILALINAMQAKGEEVPKGLRDYRIQLLKQNTRQSA